MQNVQMSFRSISFVIFLGWVICSMFPIDTIALAGVVREQMCLAKLAGEPDQPQPKSCGEQGKDNRPNSCAILIGGVWAMQHSKCTSNGDGTFTYTHCDGQSTMRVATSPQGTHLCCSTSKTCPSAKYVAACLD